ncbi:MAG: hypothetical protein JWM90_2135, partial [Thermoleophilia bacterium]|nr:hypothetical protein [Thermoleophilia bacterium]
AKTNATPVAPWSGWTERGIWAKSAVALGLIAFATSLWSIFIDGEWYHSLGAAIQIREAAEAVGRLTPFVALLSVLVEPVRYRGWVYAAFLIWAVAAASLAVGNIQDTITLLEDRAASVRTFSGHP